MTLPSFEMKLAEVVTTLQCGNLPAPFSLLFSSIFVFMTTVYIKTYSLIKPWNVFFFFLLVSYLSRFSCPFVCFRDPNTLGTHTLCNLLYIFALYGFPLLKTHIHVYIASLFYYNYDNLFFQLGLLCFCHLYCRCRYSGVLVKLSGSRRGPILLYSSWPSLHAPLFLLDVELPLC